MKCRLCDRELLPVEQLSPIHGDICARHWPYPMVTERDFERWAKKEEEGERTATGRKRP